MNVALICDIHVDRTPFRYSQFTVPKTIHSTTFVFSVRHFVINQFILFLGITPPGACCPVCGGALRLLYSRKQIDRALYALPTPNTGPLHLRSTLLALERQIQLAQCRLRGYVTIELDIFVIVQTTERYVLIENNSRYSIDL